MRRFLLAMSALAVTTAAVMACGVGTDCDFGLCAGPPVGTNEGGDGSISQIDATAPGCDPTKDQKDQEACLNDDFGVFVSLTGKPDGTGTKASPVNAVARAFELAKGTKQRIFVCEGSYEERIALKAPVSIYGGLSCTGGAWKKGESAVFKNLQQPGYALDIVRVAGLFEIVNLEFAAAPGTTITRSSIAARVVSSPGLSLKRVALTASDGSSGDPGAGGKTGDRVPATAKGSPGTAGAGGGPNACTCSIGGPTAGGAGGGPQNGGGSPGTGDATPSGATDGAPGAGGSTNCSLGLGHEGASAPPQPGGPSPSTLGVLVADAWVPGDGESGTPGLSGQGGGGGGANNAGGGAGGCGGCGGSGGAGGKGGGASIALLLIESPIALSACTLRTGNGGKGGKGGTAGSGGTPGGSGGGGPGAPNDGCAAGPGGRGGDGGHGSGGPGGVAIGVPGLSPLSCAPWAASFNAAPLGAK